MLWIFLAILVAIAAFIAYRSWLSTRHFAQLATELARVQRHAFRDVKDATHDSSPAELVAQSQQLLQNQYFKTIAGFGLAYTLDYARDKSLYVHHLSGKAPGKSAQFVAENMLLVVGTLVTQLKAADIESKGLFALEQSELGTHHLEFALTAEQQQALRAVVTGAGE